MSEPVRSGPDQATGSDPEKPWTGIFGNRVYGAFNSRTDEAELDGYGYRWLRQGNPRA